MKVIPIQPPIKKLRALEKEEIKKALKRFDSLADAARALGITPRRLILKKKRYGIEN